MGRDASGRPGRGPLEAVFAAEIPDVDVGDDLLWGGQFAEDALVAEALLAAAGAVEGEAAAAVDAEPDPADAAFELEVSPALAVLSVFGFAPAPWSLR